MMNLMPKFQMNSRRMGKVSKAIVGSFFNFGAAFFTLKCNFLIKITDYNFNEPKSPIVGVDRASKNAEFDLGYKSTMKKIKNANQGFLGNAKVAKVSIQNISWYMAQKLLIILSKQQKLLKSNSSIEP